MSLVFLLMFCCHRVAASRTMRWIVCTTEGKVLEIISQETLSETPLETLVWIDR
jgi:hypothetical protein